MRSNQADLEYSDIRDHLIYIALSICRGSLRVPERGSPLRVRAGERRVDGVKRISQKRILHRRWLAVRTGDSHLGHGDDLCWRNGIGCPVPIWHTKLLGCIVPGCAVHSVLLGNFKRMPVQNLL